MMQNKYGVWARAEITAPYMILAHYGLLYYIVLQ